LLKYNKKGSVNQRIIRVHLEAKIKYQR